MSLQSDIVSILSSVADGKVFPQAAPFNQDVPFVVYRILNKVPVNNFCGYAGKVNYVVAFDCWAKTYDKALSLAGEVDAAFYAADVQSYRDTSPGEDFELLEETFVEPTYWGFWYDSP